MKTIKNWKYEDNLIPVLELLASECSYALDDSDIDAFKAGITDDSTSNYGFPGSKSTISIAVFCEGGTCVCELTINCEDSLETRIGMLLDIAQSYYLKGGPNR